MRAILACILSLAAAACLVDAEPEPVTPTPAPGDGSALPIAKQSSNSLPENAIARFAGPLNRLVAQPFGAGTLARQIAADPVGRRLLDYSARCMFAPGQSFDVATPPSAPYLVPQAPPLKLAPSWLASPLTAEQQRYLMGCLLAHINVTGTKVLLSVRGQSPALATTLDERTQFPFLEGAFYGEFGDGTNPDEASLTRGLACWGPAYNACGPSAGSAFAKRLCTQPGACPHLTVVGPCEPGPQQPAPPAACRARTSDIFDECYPVPWSGPPPSNAYGAGVITTYLAAPVACH